MLGCGPDMLCFLQQVKRYCDGTSSVLGQRELISASQRAVLHQTSNALDGPNLLVWLAGSVVSVATAGSRRLICLKHRIQSCFLGMTIAAISIACLRSDKRTASCLGDKPAQSSNSIKHQSLHPASTGYHAWCRNQNRR